MKDRSTNRASLPHSFNTDYSAHGNVRGDTALARLGSGLIVIIFLVVLVLLGTSPAHARGRVADTLSPTRLTFASQTVGTMSVAQTVTLTNTGTTALSISGITTSRNFDYSNSCSSSLAAGAQCTISVAFAPSASGTLRGSLSIRDNASSGGQTVSLTGVGTTTITTATASDALSPTSLTFASQSMGTISAAQTVTLANTGTTSLSISGITTSGNFFQSNSCGSSLAARATCAISVTFTPSAAGTLDMGALSITDSASSSAQTVSLTGTGATTSDTLSPASLTFASQTVGTTSAAQTVTLANTGTTSLSISGITTSGNFSQSNSCGSSLVSGATCAISVTFTPSATGTLTGALSITDGASSSAQTVSLTGTGATTSDTLSPASLTFASQTVGTTSAAQTVTLANSGTTSLSISGITTSGNFSQSNSCGSSLVSGATCAISVTFTPSATGTLTGALSITDSASSSAQTVSLTGTGATTSDTLSPASLTFASQTVGTISAAQTVTLANTGTTSLSISGITTSGNFSQSNSCGSSLVSGATCTISVTFTPSATGTLTGALSITDSASSSAQTVSLTGTGASSSASDTLSPTSLTFASQTVGTTSASQTVTLTNTGSTAIAISTIAASTNFSETDNCAGTSLAAGGKCSIVVLFAPTTTGAISGSVTITDSVSASAQTVALTGAGSAPPAVSLAWTASTSSGVVGYNVYRSTVSGGYYSLLNASVVSGTTFTDSTVPAAGTYYYVTTAVNSSGAASAYSNQVTTVVP